MKTIKSPQEIYADLMISQLYWESMNRVISNIATDFNEGRIDLKTPVGDFMGASVEKIFTDFKIEIK